MNCPTNVVCVVLAAGATGAWGQIIDHADVDGVPALSQSVMNAIGQQKWFFTHASVGGNMVTGMNDLRASNPARYKLVTRSVGYNDSQQRAGNPPNPTAAGSIYECDRGNPGWEAKLNIFANSLNVSGWRAPAVQVAMDKFCYIDQDADAATAVSRIAALEAAYPATVFVYITMPLTTDEDSDNILRNQYNAVVRTHCTANHKLLFDMADMEAHDPAGNPYTFTSGGHVYQKLYSGYTDDGGHLDADGQRRIALGWYAVAAALAGRSDPADLNGDGYVDASDLPLFLNCASGAGIPHDGSTTCQRADFDHDLDVDPSDFGIFQRCYSGANTPADPACAG